MNNLIVFEGISGAGKSTVINGLKSVFTNSMSSNWFETESYRNIAGNIHKYIKMTPNIYSLIYAMEYHARLIKIKEFIEEEKTYIFLHRYIFTPMTHDTVRGTDKKLLKYLYNNFFEPNIIFFMDVNPETAYERIIKFRKPSFYECGFDISFSNNLEKGKEVYNKEKINSQYLRESFLCFQSKIYKNYIDIFNGNEKVFLIDGKLNIKEQIETIQNKIKELLGG